MPGPDAAVFDLDGVIIDSRRAVELAINAALVAHGFAARPAAELDRFIGPPVTSAFAELTGAAPTSSVVSAMIATYHARYADVYVSATRLVDGIEAVLAGLAIPLALATSKPVEFVRPLLRALAIERHFRVVCAPPMSALEEPKATTVAHALAELGELHAVMVGDRSFDVAGAHANGIRAIGVTWGIGDRAELEAAGADAIVERPAELPALLAAF
jgi:phosphoglycolate phosphatase